MIRWTLLIVFWLICLLAGLIIGYGYNWGDLKENEEIKIANYIKEIRSTFKMNTLEVNGLAKLEHTEKSNSAISFITNSLFSKDYFFQIPYIAKYGFDMENTDFQLFYKSDTIFAKIPTCKLMSFELNYSKKVVIAKEGWLVQDDDKKFEPFEKKLYESHKKILEEDQSFSKKSRDQAINSLKILIDPLGKPLQLL